MIFIGVIQFNDAYNKDQELSTIIESYTHTSSTIIKKNHLTLCYGKISERQDMDDVWENTSTILIGRIFYKTCKPFFTKNDFKNVYHLRKEEVLENIWGKYIYINTNEQSSLFEIVIDSTGQLPFFYYYLSNGNILFSSDIEIIFKVIAQKPEYNWDYLCSYLIYGKSSAIQTPFNGIYELPPACSLTITKAEVRTKPFWNPLCSYKTSNTQKRNAVSALEATLKPWIEPYKNICVSLSGGLDSSSLVYCVNNIKQEDQKLSALNYFHSSIQSSNELLHARNVCQETGIDLIEIDVSDSLPFDPFQKKQLLNPNKPFPGLVSLGWMNSVSNYIPLDDSCLLLSGHGSDHIFMCPPTKKSVFDYVIEKGVKGSKEKLKNITHFYRDSIFSVIKENAMSLSPYFCARRLDKRHTKNTQDEIPDWIRQEVHKKLSPDFKHPIYEYLPSRLLPGKYDQIDALYEGLASIHMDMDQVNRTCYPYLYQPVVEFALAFPTYELFDKGYDRYPLRKAVSDHFKTETVWRRDKSQTTGIFQLGVKKNLEHILDLCLEGEFVKQNLIDKEGLRETIILVSNGDINYIWPFIHLASIEIFLRYWNNKVL